MRMSKKTERYIIFKNNYEKLIKGVKYGISKETAESYFTHGVELDKAKEDIDYIVGEVEKPINGR